MTQQEKQLLLKDLCGRLPYEVHGEYSWKCGKPYERELTGNLMAELILSFNSSEDSEFKPYLRPMSSMTEEEIDSLSKFHIWNNGEEIFPDCNCSLSDIIDAIELLNAHYFDYRIVPFTGKTMIESNLALEAPEGMYKNE